MLVSVIVTIYNSSRYIERCVRSLVHQTYADVEYIFVNDGCTDDSMDVLHHLMDESLSLKAKSTIIEHQANEGSAASRRDGILHATGDYVIHVDSDDYVEADFVERMASCAQSTGADIVVCDYEETLNGHAHDVRIAHFDNNVDLLCRIIDGRVHSGLWNKLMRRGLFVENDFVFDVVRDKYDDKVISTQALCFAGMIGKVDAVLYHYNRDNRNSISYRTVGSEIAPALRYIAFAESFFTARNMSAATGESMAFFKVALLGNALLHGTTADVARMKDCQPAGIVRTATKHPTIPIYYKIAIIADVLHVPFVVSSLRAMMRRRGREKN